MDDEGKPADRFAVVILMVAVAGIIGAMSFPSGRAVPSNVESAALGVGSAIVAAGALIAWAILRRGR